MPHVSKQKITNKTKSELEKYISKLLFESGHQTRKEVFEEILTSTEKIMLSKRIATILMLKKGQGSYEISKKLGISYSTAERYKENVRIGKFKETEQWIKNYSGNRFIDLAIELILLPITVKKRNRKN